eukprot:snap_masked-scaffold1064_size65302-processed-gene-0.3 protein:Tk06800 transcript:snap_masked-scaffold1064_size65302-processed-gene-0.3-mRNA-1 annotation:"cytosolic carboxypeptidase 6"
MEGSGTNMCRVVNIEGCAVKATFFSMVCVGDSDDSDTEGGLGNVERVVMRPPGHSGKAKRGHLCFDASFETGEVDIKAVEMVDMVVSSWALISGNLGRVDFITENEYDLYIRPDTSNPRVRFWFHFAVENVRKKQRIIFNVVNLSKARNLFQQGMAPVVRSTKRPKLRLPPSQVYYYRSPEHSNNVVLSFAFVFDNEDESFFFALTFPYSYSRCMRVLNRIAERHQDIVQLKTVCQTSIYRNSEKTQDLFLRSLGAIEFLSSSHKIAQDLREHLDFYIFPMLNPDGVFLGNARTTLLGMDLNRCWNLENPFIHETSSVKEIVLNINQTQTLDFVLDLYGNTTLTGLFVQGNASDSVYRFERHIVLPKLIAQNCPDFEQANVMFNDDPDKAGTSRRFFWTTIGGETNVYSLEVSQHGFNLEDGTIQSYSEEDYLMHGRRIMRSLWEYYKVTGVIKTDLTPMDLGPRSGAPTETSKDFGYSLIRLRNISEQKQIFSSLESLASSAPTSEGEEDPNASQGNSDVDEKATGDCRGKLSNLYNHEHIRLRDISRIHDELHPKGNPTASSVLIGHRNPPTTSHQPRLNNLEDLRVIGTPLSIGSDKEEFQQEDQGAMQLVSLSVLPLSSPQSHPPEAFIQISSLDIGHRRASLVEHMEPSARLKCRSVGGGGRLVTAVRVPTGTLETRTMHYGTRSKEPIDIYVKPMSLQHSRPVTGELLRLPSAQKKRKKRKKSSKMFHPEIIVSDTN